MVSELSDGGTDLNCDSKKKGRGVDIGSRVDDRQLADMSVGVGSFCKSWRSDVGRFRITAPPATPSVICVKTEGCWFVVRGENVMSGMGEGSALLDAQLLLCSSA